MLRIDQRLDGERPRPIPKGTRDLVARGHEAAKDTRWEDSTCGRSFCICLEFAILLAQPCQLSLWPNTRSRSKNLWELLVLDLLVSGFELFRLAFR